MGVVFEDYDQATRQPLLQSGVARALRIQQRYSLFSQLMVELKLVQNMMINNVKELSVVKLNKLLLKQVYELKDPREPLSDQVMDQIVTKLRSETNALLDQLSVSFLMDRVTHSGGGGGGASDEYPQSLSTIFMNGEEDELSLNTFASEFESRPETRAFRRDLLLRFSQKQSTMPKKPPGISPKLNLVAYICPRGNGNFNGYGNFALGAHSLLVAADNSHRGEENGDNRPLISFQPKLHLDVSI